MASGNQMCKGNIADLPAPPINIKKRAVGSTHADSGLVANPLNVSERPGLTLRS